MKLFSIKANLNLQLLFKQAALAGLAREFCWERRMMDPVHWLPLCGSEEEFAFLSSFFGASVKQSTPGGCASALHILIISPMPFAVPSL